MFVEETCVGYCLQYHHHHHLDHHHDDELLLFTNVRSENIYRFLQVREPIVCVYARIFEQHFPATAGDRKVLFSRQKITAEIVLLVNVRNS